jgi:LuxR family transcriptional regulator/LuxR family quorum-sensing system transcriptional regulator CciR
MRDMILENISTATNVSALWGMMVDYYVRKGFDAVRYVLLKHGEPHMPVAIFDHGETEAVAAAYVQMDYAKHDPAARLGLSLGKPFTADQIEDLSPLSRQELAHHKKLQALGIGRVLFLPVFGPYTINGIIALAFARAPDLIDSLNWEKEQATAQLIHLRCVALLPERPIAIPNPLSDRELEILRWVAQGKSNSVIAEIMQIAAGTVDTYLRRIFQKLDVTDRTTAAVRGVSYGFIRG